MTAAATYYMAETYFDFSQSLSESERPAGLQPSEMSEYELALEEEAFPFEEMAIEFHEKNLELLHAGIFNSWTEKSLGKLADLVPGRYAKTEMSSGFLHSIDTYVYRSPAPDIYGPVWENADLPVSGEEPVETTSLTPIVEEDREVDHANSL